MKRILQLELLLTSLLWKTQRNFFANLLQEGAIKENIDTFFFMGLKEAERL